MVLLLNNLRKFFGLFESTSLQIATVFNFPNIIFTAFLITEKNILAHVQFQEKILFIENLGKLQTELLPENIVDRPL